MDCNNKVIDHFIASSYVRAQDEVEKPYSFELNKKQPRITREELLPENIASYPKLQEEVVPLVDGFIKDLQRLEQISASIAQQEKMLREMLSSQIQEKNQLKVKLNETAQKVGQVVQDIDPQIDLVLTTCKEFMVAAQRKLVVNTQNTMAPDAQLEVLKKILMDTNQVLGAQVIMKFSEAMQKFETTTSTYEKTLRVWPIPQEKMQGKAIKLVAQIENSLENMVNGIYHDIVEAMSGLHRIVGILHSGINKINGSNVIKMPAQNNQVPLAAMKLSNLG